MAALNTKYTRKDTTTFSNQQKINIRIRLTKYNSEYHLIGSITQFVRDEKFYFSNLLQLALLADG